MSRADILSHNCILMKLLKYYLTSGTSEKNQTLGIIIQVLFLFVFFPPPQYLNSCVERKHLTKRSS